MQCVRPDRYHSPVVLSFEKIVLVLLIWLCSQVLCMMLRFIGTTGFLWGWMMDSDLYRKWLEEIDALSLAQRAEVQSLLAGRSSEAEVIAALERRVLAECCCAHCQHQGWSAAAVRTACAGSIAWRAARPSMR